MINSETTLNQFFSLNETELLKKSLSDLESTKNISSLKEKVLKEEHGIRWPMAFDEMVKKLGNLLDISVPDIMISAWKKYEELQKYADCEKYSPDETFLVVLAEHTITSEHHPYVEVLVNDRPIGKIDFDASISFSIKGIVLKIMDGKIKEVLTGSCKGKGTIKCENLLLFEKETKDIPLPGSITLGEGVPIAK